MNKFFGIIGCALFLTACQVESVDYPNTPSVEFKEVLVENSVDLLGNPVRSVTLHFYLIDGNGDIGPFYTDSIFGNCHVELFCQDLGQWKKFYPPKLDTVVYNMDTIYYSSLEWVNMPSPGELGQDNTLKADIYVDIAYSLGIVSEDLDVIDPVNYDTFFYAVKVYDLALNESNMAYSDTIILDETLTKF